ncbi:hypothetical protein D3C77_451380 [compost metagenome]
MADTEAFLLSGHHEASGGQARQGFAQRDHPGVIGLGQLLEAQLAAWQQATIDDVLAYARLKLGSHGAFVGAIAAVYPAFWLIHDSIPNASAMSEIIHRPTLCRKSQ